MTDTPRVYSIAAGTPFLPALVEALRSGKLAPGVDFERDPLAWAGVTIYLPTRRAARTLRSLLAEADGGRPTILPVIKALGEFDEDEMAFDANGDVSALIPPVPSLDRLLMLAPLVERWKRQLPQAILGIFDEPIVVPVSRADTIWLARDLARLMDDMETESGDWTKLAALAPEDFANWWQVTLTFLAIATEAWPQMLAERGMSDPAAYRNALIRMEAARLQRNPPAGPVIAAGSTGSIPATADLLAVIARLPKGAVVLPGLDTQMSERSWQVLSQADKSPAVFGHPQFGLKRLIERLGVTRELVEPLGDVAPALAVRGRVVSDAMRPAETTDEWQKLRNAIPKAEMAKALQDVSLIEAANEREEALAIAVALRLAISEPGRQAALVTADRTLARRVATELLRFGIEADDSGGAPLANTPPAVLLRLLVRAVFEPDNPVRILSLVKHPLLHLGMERAKARAAAETVELVALRGGSGRPNLAKLLEHFDKRLQEIRDTSHKPNWFARLNGPNNPHVDSARKLLRRLDRAIAPLLALAGKSSVGLIEIAAASVTSLEALARDNIAGLSELYDKNSGEKLAEFLRDLMSAREPIDLAPSDWPDVLEALITSVNVKPRVVDDNRVAIWGTLEARLQSVDTLVLGGLNEGSWPRKARGDRFLSRLMRTGLNLPPPEREIGLAAHDFEMALGGGKVVLSRSARAGDSPATPSRWLQRLLTFVGEDDTKRMKAQGDDWLTWSRDLDKGKDQSIPRAFYAPPLDQRPKSFSVTEVERLRRDPYAVYAKRILKLTPIEPLISDPAALERGTLFHLILQRFVEAGVDPDSADALARLIEMGAQAFAEFQLPTDVQAVWWPRFERMAGNYIAVENERSGFVASHAEVKARKIEVETTGVVLSGSADRIDILKDGSAVIIDYKTGSYPSRLQAHTLIAPQLPLEAALLKRGGFDKLEAEIAADLIYYRLKANGTVLPESILKPKSGSPVPADELGDRAWEKLNELLVWFQDPANGYLSRMLPFKESDMEGDYDHLARVMEWSAGADDEDEEANGE